MEMFERGQHGLWLPKKERLKAGGVYRIEHYRAGKLIETTFERNIVVFQGLDSLLSVALCAGSQIANWYLGLFSGNYVPTSNDTAASIAGNATEAQGYTSTTRVAWTPVEGSQQASNAASPATFTFNTTASIYGAFLISASGKGSTSGTLFSATQFSTPKNVVNTDNIVLTYAVGAASS